MGGPKAERAGGGERSCADHVAGGFKDGYGFTCQHGLVDMALALGHDAVYGHPPPRPDPQDVAHLHLINGKRSRDSAVNDLCRFGAQTDQAAHGIPRSPFGARLQPAAQQDQGNDDGCSLEIHTGGGQNARGQHSEGRKQKGSPCAQRHERIHIRARLEQAGDATPEKIRPRSGQHAGGQGKLSHMADLHAYIGRDPMVQRWIEVPAHFRQKHRHCKRPCHHKAPEKRARRVLGRCVRRGRRGWISRIRQRIADLVQRAHRLHRDTVVGQVGADRERPGHVHHCRFNPSHAGGTGHGRDIQAGLSHLSRITRRIKRLHHRIWCHT
mmetsp:Transcript_22699/g.37414  ORF Transcript_22699/g.37414 Transcript_22699/m.37414 type:complete len:325 (-) Transcript_22699:130-1104(-)